MNEMQLSGFFDEMEKIAVMPSPARMSKLLDSIGAASGKFGRKATPRGARTTLSFPGGKMKRTVNPPPIPANA